MLLTLFFVLWGAMLSLILCAPYSYYPVFIGIISASVVAFFISIRFIKSKSKRKMPVYISYFLAFVVSYSACSYLVFKPKELKYINNSNISKSKKAVIFYCQGEMEKYSPYFTDSFLKDTPFYLKPLGALKIKNIYRSIDVNNKNKDLISVASDVKNSILNYKPYYFYLAFSDYFPDIHNSINSAVSDGCSEIIVINYTNDSELEKKLNTKLSFEILKEKGISINFTAPVYFSKIFPEAITSRIVNMSIKWDGILLIDSENDTSTLIKDNLLKAGYDNRSIYVSKDIEKAFDYFKENNFKNILYYNLQDSSGGIKSELSLPEKIEKYSKDMKITGIKGWGYDRSLSKAVIDTFLKLESSRGK